MPRFYSPFRWPLPGVSHWGIRLAALITAGLVGAVLAQDTRVSDQERDLVQKVHEARRAYQSSLERLRSFYHYDSNQEKRSWVEKELTDYHMVVKNPYILEFDLPSRDLRPTKNITKANLIFRDAMEWMNQPFTVDKRANYVRAELLLRRMIQDYPDSDKLFEACYYLGEIYSSKYYKQYRRAAAYYERVLDYQPNTSLNARVRAAYIHETELADRRRAIELYQEVLKRETNISHTREAKKRLDALLGQRGPARQ